MSKIETFVEILTMVIILTGLYLLITELGTWLAIHYQWFVIK